MRSAEDAVAATIVTKVLPLQYSTSVKKNFSSPAGQKGVWVADGVGVWVGVVEKDAWAE